MTFAVRGMCVAPLGPGNQTRHHHHLLSTHGEAVSPTNLTTAKPTLPFLGEAGSCGAVIHKQGKPNQIQELYKKMFTPPAES